MTRDPATIPPTIGFVIPALNEEETIGGVIAELASVAARPTLREHRGRIFLVDNGSDDRTAERAAAAGATVVSEPRRGYGRACLSGVLAAEAVEIIVLLDGDGSDRPDDLPLLLQPILAGEADLVLGSRSIGRAEPGSLLAHQRFGNRFAALLLRLVCGARVTDIPPFRAIRREVLLSLGMREMTYGWSVEMIARAARRDLRIREVPVSYRRRAGGVSKVSGNLRASLVAGWRITTTIVRFVRTRTAT